MRVVIEILDDEGAATVSAEEDAGNLDTLRWMEADRVAEGGYLHLDSNVYAMPVRVVGVIDDDESPDYDDTRDFRLIKPLGAL